VQWEKVPVDKIHDVPADKLQFDKMNKHQIGAVTEDQVKARITDIKPNHVGMLSDDTIAGLNADDADAYLSQRLTESSTGKYMPDNPKEWKMINRLFPYMDESLYMRKTETDSSPIRREDLLFTKTDGNYAILSGPSSAVMLDHNVALEMVQVGEDGPEYLKVGMITMKDAEIEVLSSTRYSTQGIFDADGIGQMSVYGTKLDSPGKIPLSFVDPEDIQQEGSFMNFHEGHLMLYDTQMSLMPGEENQINTITIRNVEGSTTIDGPGGNIIVLEDTVVGQQNLANIGIAGNRLTHVDKDYNKQSWVNEGGVVRHVPPACDAPTGNVVSRITGMLSYGMCGGAASNFFSFFSNTEEAAEGMGSGLTEMAIRQMPDGQKVELIKNHDPDSASDQAVHEYKRTIWWCYGSRSCKDMCQADDSCSNRMAELLPD
jgi:hypothetical protein